MTEVKRVVIKVGSSTLTDPAGGLDRAYVQSLIEQIAALREKGIDVVLVSSGAIAAGRRAALFSDRFLRGEELGKGRKLSTILDEMKMVAEGVNTARSVVQLRDKYNVPMPIASAMESVT